MEGGGGLEGGHGGMELLKIQGRQYWPGIWAATEE
jgi:hypothetical protein